MITHQKSTDFLPSIGDAYMVVSGLPERNGLQHAGEIASMSLDFLNEMKSFTVKHKPDEKLEIRIGIHTGEWKTDTFYSKNYISV